MADSDWERIEQLVKNPGESLVVEIKTWISPAEHAGQAKIIKAVIALRNRGGGYLVIGFNDESLRADRDGMPRDVRAMFHVDVIQGLITKYASDTFEIKVEFVDHDGITHPIIVVPSGIKTPVAAKADLKGLDGTSLIRVDDVYVRTLRSNNTPSTARAQWKDWADLVEICFNNREADIGRFLRRHVVGADFAALREFAKALASNGPIEVSVRERLNQVMEHGLARFNFEVKDRDLVLPAHGTWEIALIIDGQFPPLAASEEFANLLSASNPSHTGWPVWLSSKTFGTIEQRPYVYEGAWETLIASIGPTGTGHIDFMRQEPTGLFYSYRALEDDVSWADRRPKPMTSLDPILQIENVTEAMAVGLAFARAFGADEDTKLEFLFRWNGLKNRVLHSWENPGRQVSPRQTHQNTVTSTASVPLDTAPSALPEFTKAALRPLYEVFDGFTMPGSIVDEVARKVLETRW